MASGDAGLVIIKVSDPKNPVLVVSVECGFANAVSTVEIGVKIYSLVMDYYTALKIIEVSDP